MDILGVIQCFVERNTALFFFSRLSFLRPGFNVLGTAKIVVVVCFLKRICFSSSRYFTKKKYTPKLVEKVKKRSWQVDLIPHFVVAKGGW